VAALCWYWKLWEVGFVVREFVLFCSFVVVVLLVCGFVEVLCGVWWWCGGVVLVLESTGSLFCGVKGFVVLLFSCCCVVVL